MERGFTMEVELSENDFRNYQSLGSYFKQNKKYKEKKMEKAQANFDKSTSTETKNEIAGNKVSMEMINFVVSDNQQSYKKKPYSYRKLISNPRNKSITENIQECENKKAPAQFFIETNYDEEEITAATSTDNDYDTFVRYKTITQKADVTKCFNNMLKDYLEKDAGTCTLRKCAGLPKKDFDLETFLRYYTTTIELRNLSQLSHVKYHSNRRSKEQKPGYSPWSEGSSFKSLSLDYYGLGHTGTRNKDNPDKAAETSLGTKKNDSKKNSDKRKLSNLKLGSIPHRRFENSVKEGVLWQQTNNPFFR